MIKSKNIELFKNISEYDYGENHFDFHNDYDCIKLLLLTGDFLVLIFRNILNKKIVKLRFSNAIIERMEMFNFNKVENLTIDNLYRGKTEINGKLVEFKNDDKGYYYLEFDEGQKLEYWSTGLDIEM